ncbi:hypothetical protein B0H34DRAFT_248668 [Crassisporium funariophilum]|nr:hypothetical protein B0H34DRAFT_248668 [Crassisporium funariophilum]
MSLTPNLRPQIVAGKSDAPHTLDIFLDYVCPYSAKMALKIDKILKPLMSSGGKYDGRVKVIFRLQVQPWHASSTLTHEAGLAALRVSPENFWSFSLLLFQHQEEYFDIPSQDLSPRQIRENLAKLASEVLPPGAVSDFKDILTLKGSPNGGTAVTDDLKYNIKYSRQNSIHVSPTALWDGIVANEVSSGWEEKEWTKFLEDKAVI